MSLVSYKVSGNRPWIIGQQRGRYKDLHGGKDKNSVSLRNLGPGKKHFDHLRFRDRFVKATVKLLQLDE
jgi:hypothetical protein